MAEASAKIKVGGIEVPQAFLARRPTTATKTTVKMSSEAASAPSDNPVYQVIFSPNTTPEQQRAELAAYLTFTGTKEDSKARMKALPVPRLNADVIERLEELLIKAREGQIVGFVYGTVQPIGNVNTGWTGDASQHSMLSASVLLYHRLMHTLLTELKSAD